MKMYLILFVIAAFAGKALAAEPDKTPTPAAPPSFTPFTVQETDVQNLENQFLNNPPRVYEQVINQWLSGLEQRAVHDASHTVEPSNPKTEPHK